MRPDQAAFQIRLVEEFLELTRRLIGRHSLTALS